MALPHLSRAEHEGFVRDGLVVRRGLLSPAQVDGARKLVEAALPPVMTDRQLRDYTQTTFVPELGSHPALLDLLRGTAVASLAADLLRPTGYEPVAKVQIQIRLPEAQPPALQPDKAMHVDGVACPHLDAAELRTFTLLVGIFLTPVTGGDEGGLRVVRGGHLTMARWFQEDWYPGCPEQTPASITSEPGEVVVGEPGDILFMHHATPHAVGSNHTSTPRIMLYYRLKAIGHDTQRLVALRDPWLEYPALRDLAPV